MEREDIVEQLATGKMSRRKFNRNLMALGATMVMMPLGSQFTQAASTDHPTVFTWEGWEVPELHKAYLDKHGSSPNMAIFADEEEAFAKMRAGFKVDLTQPCTYKVPIWYDAGILDPIDTSRLGNWPDIIFEPQNNSRNGYQWAAVFHSYRLGSDLSSIQGRSCT